MPLYEYKCQACSHVSEVIQRMSDPPLSTCDRCGGELKKLLSAPAFQFKGTGWYVTDYADKGKSGKSGKGGSGSGDSKPKGDSKSDSDGSSDSSGGSDSTKSEGKTKSERVASD